MNTTSRNARRHAHRADRHHYPPTHRARRQDLSASLLQILAVATSIGVMLPGPLGELQRLDAEIESQATGLQLLSDTTGAVRRFQAVLGDMLATLSEPGPTPAPAPGGAS